LGHLLAAVCNLAATILSAGASYHWYRASTVKPPPEMLPRVMGYSFVDTRPLVQFVKDSSDASRAAAVWSVFAASAWAVSGITTFFN
jgi:hypothetical protein